MVGLNHKTQPVPARQTGRMGQLLQQVQRQLQPVRFLGVDIDADVVAFRLLAQLQHAGQQLIHHALPLRTAVARVQGAELDGNAGPFVNAAAVAGFANGINGIHIRLQIALCIVGGERRLAQHVVGIAKALGLQFAGAFEGLGNGLAHHKLLAHQAHGHVYALAHQWLATSGRQSLEGREQARFAVRIHQLAGNHQPPGCGVDKQRRAFAQMRLPVTTAQLVANQRVACIGIGNAQQRLGQAHQGHAFLRRQRKLLQQALHQPLTAHAGRLCTQLLHQPLGMGCDLCGLGGGQDGRRQQLRDRLGLVHARGGRDGAAQCVGRAGGAWQRGEYRGVCLHSGRRNAGQTAGGCAAITMCTPALQAACGVVST